jgi:hypothetical protein
VSFGFEHTLVFHGRDRPSNDHWRPVKQGSKMDEYFGLFSLKNHDLQVFWHDGEPNSGMTGFRYGRGDWIVFLLDLMHLDFLKIGLGFSTLLFKLFI